MMVGQGRWRGGGRIMDHYTFISLYKSYNIYNLKNFTLRNLIIRISDIDTHISDRQKLYNVFNFIQQSIWIGQLSPSFTLSHIMTIHPHLCIVHSHECVVIKLVYWFFWINFHLLSLNYFFISKLMDIPALRKIIRNCSNWAC